jgi:hypothetical protein
MAYNTTLSTPYAGILTYCSVIQNDDASTDFTFSNIAANWARAAELWDDGIDKYIFWGDVSGDCTFFEMEFTVAAWETAEVIAANYSNAVDLKLYQAKAADIGSAFPVVNIEDCMYDFGVTSKQPKQVGDKIVIEGGTQYKIFVSNE